MAKNKEKIGGGTKSPLPKSTLNSLELANLLKPFRETETNTYYLTNEIKDETGKVVRVESVPQDSDSGQLLIRSAASEMLRDTFADYDLRHANEVLKGKALRDLPRPAVNPVEVPLPAGGLESVRKRSRPTFQEFTRAISNEGVTVWVDFQQNIRVEFPGDPELGLPADWEVNSERVKAWLHRFYLEQYGLRLEDSELAGAVRWLRSEAYVWGMGVPSADGSVNTLDDDAVFVGVRGYCAGLTKVGEQLIEWATPAFHAIRSRPC